MKTWSLLKLFTIGVIAGFILAGFLIFIHLLTGNEAYILLFNVDYIPILKDFPYETATGLMLHFVICVLVGLLARHAISCRFMAESFTTEPSYVMSRPFMDDFDDILPSFF